MQDSISKSVFKAQALEIMREVEESGEAVVITSHGKKSLVLSVYRDASVSPLDKLKNSIVSYEDPFEPVAEEDWIL
jgi:prevent-host-death family protein